MSYQGPETRDHEETEPHDHEGISAPVEPSPETAAPLQTPDPFAHLDDDISNFLYTNNF